MSFQHAALEELSRNHAFAGYIVKYKYKSKTLGDLSTQFNIFLPKEAESASVPVLYYLAGLTCTEDTGAWKGGFLRDAAEEGIALVFPDTSPRGANVPGEDDSWDFGTGAGFYLNATEPKFSKHYNMFSFITEELPEVLKSSGLPIDPHRQSIFGHSMGGHGAITLHLLKPGQYRSASAFSPILNPTQAPWGHKAFGGYLAGGTEEGKKWDATELISTAKGRRLNIRIDYGDADQFYQQKQLLPENFVAAARAAGFGEDDVQVQSHSGYDHSYYFISTFGREHIQHHAKYLKA
ncbi:carbohydrate esterase family 1 protein [Botryobasidium botryosum FD-172 SS1]|uniref:S-formylglutathione hydrolase n=1 Tax=Botryobasidium botryosum (strain FD-172 SS1) TaxID=930990 RepID=A0A067N1X8_BOTB1|nr:carbohydrate esterase family 1 protein [Botryobasidium botryosum FD-172 SS1]